MSECRVYNSNLAFTDNNHTGIDPTPGGSNPANGAPYDAELLSVHELGHSLGLKHSNTILSTMNRFWPNSGNVSRQNLSLFQTDDLKGLRISYRTPDNRINLVASKYKNFFGEKADVNKVKRADTNARTDILTRGNAYFVDYTIANHSADSNSQSNVRVGVYLSTNDTISQFDTFLGSTTLTNMFNKTYSSTLWVQIPNTVATGTYFLGYMVDDQTNIAEINEQDNNVTLLNSQAGTSFTVN